MTAPRLFRRVSPASLTSLVALALAALGVVAALGGCGSSGTAGQSGPAGGASGTSAATGTVGASKAFTLDLDASHKGRPHTWTESTVTAEWFPTPGIDGLRQQLDAKQIAALTHAISGNSQFWIEVPDDHTSPLLFGRDAVSRLATSTGFSAGTVVPVYDVTSVSTNGPVLGSTPVSYQVLLSGNVGATSFGMRPGSGKGVWLLDPNGELVNWSVAIDAIGRDAGFVSTSASVVHTAFDLGGKPALYLSWAVFRDAKGRMQAVALHSPPRIKATWAIGDRLPLQLGRTYDMKTIAGPVTITVTK